MVKTVTKTTNCKSSQTLYSQGHSNLHRNSKVSVECFECWALRILMMITHSLVPNKWEIDGLNKWEVSLSLKCDKRGGEF